MTSAGCCGIIVKNRTDVGAPPHGILVKKKNPKTETPADSQVPSASEKDQKRSSGDGPAKPRVRADQRLVHQCLAGDDQAWERLYRRCHPRLLSAIKHLLGEDGADIHVVDDIAARVWYELLRDDAALLASYDGLREIRLDAFLAGLARIEIMRYVRSEHRRRSHEFIGGRKMLAEQRTPDWKFAPMMDEFVSSLTPQERMFMENFLIAIPEPVGEGGSMGLSPSNVWQRRHRLRSKLKRFLQDL